MTRLILSILTVLGTCAGCSDGKSAQDSGADGGTVLLRDADAGGGADLAEADLCQSTEHATGFVSYTPQGLPVPEAWTDCVAKGTYNLEQATRACEAHRAKNGITAPCVAVSCSAPRPDGDAVALNLGAGDDCGVWMYSGASAGRVGTISGEGCRCPSVTEPWWN